jgi:hypothetical protein
MLDNDMLISIGMSGTNHVVIDGLQLYNLRDHDEDNDSYLIKVTAGVVDATIRNCVFKSIYTTYTYMTTHGYNAGTVNSGGSSTLYNNVFLDCRMGINGGNYYPTYAYNNTIIRPTRGIISLYDLATAKNNICVDAYQAPGASAADCYYAGSGGGFNNDSDYNISDVSGDTTGGAHDIAVDGQEPSFVDKAGGNAHLSSGDTIAKNAGVDLSGVFSTDIDGNARNDGTWDIGMDEYAEGEEVSSNVTSSMGVCW